MGAPEQKHFGALEPIPAVQVAVSPKGQLTLHIWSSLSFVAAHSDCAVTDCERVPKLINPIKISACLQVIRRISPPLTSNTGDF
jgi:hypothetical protein